MTVLVLAAKRDYARREAKIGVGGTLFALPGVLWVNRPDLAATTVYRPLQCSDSPRNPIPASSLNR
jgi:hypothetical protein